MALYTLSIGGPLVGHCGMCHDILYVDGGFGVPARILFDGSASALVVGEFGSCCWPAATWCIDYARLVWQTCLATPKVGLVAITVKLHSVWLRGRVWNSLFWADIGCS